MFEDLEVELRGSADASQRAGGRTGALGTVGTLAAGELRFEVHAKPRAKRSAIVGVRAGALDVCLAAPPVDGAANEELVATLTRVLGIPRRNIVLVRGEASRAKRVAVVGLTPDELRERLAASVDGRGR
jgi:uncharacterized protein (TIGR00251 family)